MSAPVPTPEQQAQQQALLNAVVKQLREQVRAEHASLREIAYQEMTVGLDPIRANLMKEGHALGILFGKLIITLPIPDRAPVLDACLSKGIAAAINEWMHQVEQGRLDKCNAEEVATFTEKAGQLVEAMSKPIATPVVESNNNEYTDPDA